MSQPTLLAAHFDEAFSAPDGLKRLRELILTLAMQGKLVKQDPAEGTADDLLKEIEAEKKWLVTEGKVKPPKTLPAIEPEEVPYELPEGWRWVRLGEIAEYNGRDTARAGEIKADTWLLDLEDIEKETSKILYRATYSERDSKSNKTLFMKGDVLYGKLRPYLTKIVVADSTGICTTEIVPIVPSRVLDSNFLLLLLKRPDFLNYVNALMYGVKMPRLGTEQAVMSLHPLPPLVEQRRIVARIEQLMARCDELEALRAQREYKRVQVQSAILREITADTDPATFQQNWQFLADHFGELHATPQNVAELRSAVLQLAVMGKLVPQDPAEGSVDDLIADLQFQRNNLQKFQTSPLKEIDFGVPMPTTWRVRDLGSLLAFGPSNGYSPKAVNFPTKTKSLTLSATTLGYFRSEHIKYVNEIIPEDSELWLKEGDILIQRGNTLDYVGVPAIYIGSPREFIYPDLMMKIRLLKGLNIKYIYYVMSSRASRDYLRSRASGTSGTMPKINQAAVKGLPIPLPPLAEQRRIVAKIDQLMGLCDVLEARLTERTAKQGELLRAVMAELAPTLPAGRPATPSRARAQAPASTDAPRGRGRPRKAVLEGVEVAAQPVTERRGRGRPRKDGSSPGRSIPEAASMEDAIRRLEALKRSKDRGMNGLFEE